MKKILTLAIATLASAFVANAVPAKPGFRTLEQPDGTTIRVQLVGDEYSHYYVTEDNVILLPGEDGVLRYAETDAAGKLALSAVKAQNAAVRSAEGVLAVKRADNARIMEAIGSRARQSMARRAPSRVADQSGLGRFSGNYPRTGKVHGIVFLVEYRDVKFKIDDPHTYFSRMLNEEGFSENGATGSARDYFLAQSDGQFDVTFDVYGPVTLSQNRSYYGANDAYGNDIRAEVMVTEGAKLMNDQINFADYDYDNDGEVDNIFVIYAGYGEASGGPDDSVWPHNWDLPPLKQISLDGKTIVGYACANELNITNIPTGIGTVCHEFSHVMGLPDLYSTMGTQMTCTPGKWDVMDMGSYNNDGRTPPCYSAFERNAMGWLDPVVVTGAESVKLEHIAASNTTYLIPTADTNEFFLLENRQQNGWDKYLPYHGMLIWHVDFNQAIWDNNSVNNNSRHQYVDIEEANNNPINSSLSAMRGYPFPGTAKKTSFTSTTSPALKSWDNKAINLPITNITETADGLITFDIDGGRIDLATPAAPEAKATETGTIELKWAAVPEADEYLLNVYTRDGAGAAVPFGEYTDLSVGNALTHTVEGVAGETEYFATVTARKGRNVSEPSSEAAVTTPRVDIVYIVPAATSATMENGTATFSWLPVKDAAKYLVTIEIPTSGGAVSQTLDFGSSDDFVAIPEGWNWTGDLADLYGSRSTQYFGEGAPSLKFMSTGATLTSPRYDSDVTEISFWLRGASPSGNSTFTVEGRNQPNDKWVPLRSIVLVNEAKKADIFTVKPEDDVRQVRFTYSKVGGNAALDDVKISYTDFVYGTTDEYSRIDAGTQTSYSMPFSADDCYFYVEAMNAEGRYSKPSNKVRLNKNSGAALTPGADSNASVITGAGTLLYTGEAGTAVRIVNLAGTTVAAAVTDAQGSAEFNLPAGFYIVATDHAAIKAIVR